MPISHEHKAIFIHIPKTAGSSIEKALGIYGVDNAGSNESDERIFYGIRQNRALQHFTGEELAGCLSPDIFKSYFKFAVVRNPFDRLVSSYCFHHRFVPNPISFEQYLNRLAARRKILYCLPPMLRFNRQRILRDDHFISQHRFVFDRWGRRIVDFVGRYEEIDEVFSMLQNRFRIKEDLPHINSVTHAHYREYYSVRMRRLAGLLYQRDLSIFGYRF